jgi:hypothetical protein
MNYILICISLVIAVIMNGCVSGKLPSNQTPFDTAQSGLTSSPANSSKIGLELYPRTGVVSDWHVIREWPSWNVRIFLQENQVWKEIPFSQTTKTLALKVVENSDSLFVFAFDKEKNSASRQAPENQRFIGLWKFSKTSTNATLLSEGLALGGLDNVIYAVAGSTHVDACAVDRCIRIGIDSRATQWTVPELAGKEIVDLKFDSDGAYALVRHPVSAAFEQSSSFSPLFSAFTLANPNSTVSPNLQNVPATCMPYGLSKLSDRPVWRCANSPAELAEVFAEDLNRQKYSGLGDVGSSNEEGRIAWSLVYTLNSLLQLSPKYPPNLYAAKDWTAQRAILPTALDLVARQGLLPIGYGSRRYSTDRRPLVFGLHIGRIAQLLSAGQDAGYTSPYTQTALQSIRLQLQRLDSTAESLSSQGENSKISFRRGIAFWADGAEVPYNFSSGIAYGLLASSFNQSPDSALAINILEPRIRDESLAVVDAWSYWPVGYGRTGWGAADNVSTNTPSYNGNAGVADISYRSLDATAVIRLASMSPTVVDDAVIRNLSNLVKKERLYPSTNQELARINRGVKIDPRIARYYSRSTSAWEQHSQIFALEALTLP